MNSGSRSQGYRKGNVPTNYIHGKKSPLLLTSVSNASPHRRHREYDRRDDNKRAYRGSCEGKSGNIVAGGGLVRSDDDDDDRSSGQYPLPATQWIEWSQLSSDLTTSGNRRTLSTVVEGKSQEKQTVTELELLHTRELLLQYKDYVEKRLMRHIQILEEKGAQRDQLCKRLKRDNALLLEELDRYRAAAPETAVALPSSSKRLNSQCHSPPVGQQRQSTSPSFNSLLPSQSVHEEAPKSVIEVLRSREETLLCQLQEERTCREQMEIVHAEAMKQLQNQVAVLEEERRVSIDSTTIQRLREVISRRDEEIRQLRRFHGFSITEPLEKGERDGEKDNFVTELRQVAGDSMDFITAMNMTVATAFGDDMDFSSAVQSWEEARRVVASLSKDAATSLQLMRLMDAARSIRCAMEHEHKNVALFVRKLLTEREDLRASLATERREWDVERQAATHRLSEVEEEGAAMVRRLQEELDAISQRASSWMGMADPYLQHKRAENMTVNKLYGHDVATQTLLSAELSSVVRSGAEARPISSDGSYDPIPHDVEYFSDAVGALERDNAAKAALIAQLQQQRERFLGSVDTELALNQSARMSLSVPFSQYLLE